ncbi:MAG: hypothetical protein ACO3JG_16315 [Luteolibacter sp.]
MISDPQSRSALARVLLLSFGFCIGACRENPREAEPVDPDTRATLEQQQASPAQDADTPGEADSSKASPSPDEQITELRRTIESGRETIESLEAFVQMERAKVENDPGYETSFLEEALAEQQEIREAVESGEKRLQELTRPNE